MAKDNFKVVIGGGSISGLALANMLQLYNIDFVILEAYPNIAPQVGASIGMLPHGNRILDQLGLFQKILDLCPPLDSFHFRDHTGNIICEFRGMRHSMYERHGYPIAFLDRQMVLQVLYENIKDKSKVLTSKRVQKIDMTDDGVVVRTSDGSHYEGDIAVGCDGIHSNVREEMWRIANEQSPDWIPADERSQVPCDFGCIFGISKPCEGIEPGSSNSVFKKHESYILNGGPEGRVYWFYFWKLAQRAYGKDIPSYTNDDKLKILSAHKDDDITPTMKFKEVMDKAITSVAVPLQEYVFRKWYFKRILTIGDAAHKFHPIAGHGGNACLESAATFVNLLREALAKSRSGKPTLEQIQYVFQKTQDIRQARTTTLKENSHEQQRTELLDTPLHNVIAHYLLPLTDTEDITFHFSRNMPLAEKLNSPNLRPKPKLVPYKDELLSTPRSRGSKKYVFMAIYLLIAGLVYYGMWIWSAHWDLEKQLGAIIETGKFQYDPSFTLKRKYFRIKPVDDYLVFLAAIFMPGLNMWDKNFGTLQLYFLGSLIQPIAVWTVEAYRKRNLLTPLTLITIWFTLLQSAGIGIYMPIYYAVYTYVSEAETYWWPLNRGIQIQYAKFLLWAVLVGYALPTILMFTPWKDPNTIQNFEALWQLSPMLVPLICTVLGLTYARRYNIKYVSPTARQPFDDIPYLKRLYVVTGVLGVALHVYCVAKIIGSPEMSLVSVFWADLGAQPKELGEGLKSLFLVDFWGFYIASYAWLCMAVWDLKRMGRKTIDVGKASVLIALGHVIVGPGATMSVVWYWREEALAKTSFASDHV